MNLPIIGAIINASAILIGGGIGLLLKGRIKREVSQNLMRILGLCVIVFGISDALQGDVTLLVISLALGTFAGELLRIDHGLNKLGAFAQKKLTKGDESSTFAEGFVTTTLLFCVGAFAIVGSMNSGLQDDQSMIITKSVIDMVAAMMFASYLGVGVLLSAFAVLLYQGSIEYFAGFFYGVLSPELITHIAAAGGVMVLGIGVNMLLDTKIKIANFLPGFLFAAAYYYLFLA